MIGLTTVNNFAERLFLFLSLSNVLLRYVMAALTITVSFFISQPMKTLIALQFHQLARELLYSCFLS